MVRVHQPATPLPTRPPPAAATPWPSAETVERATEWLGDEVDTNTFPTESMITKLLKKMNVILRPILYAINSSSHPELFRLIFKLFLIGIFFVCVYLMVVRLSKLTVEVSRKVTGWPRKIKEF